MNEVITIPVGAGHAKQRDHLAQILNAEAHAADRLKRLLTR
jgi:hypothetical protein